MPPGHLQCRGSGQTGQSFGHDQLRLGEREVLWKMGKKPWSGTRTQRPVSGSFKPSNPICPVAAFGGAHLAGRGLHQKIKAALRDVQASRSGSGDARSQSKPHRGPVPWPQSAVPVRQREKIQKLLRANGKRRGLFLTLTHKFRL